MSALLIRQGRVIDPSQSLDRVMDLLVVDGKIAAYDPTPRGDEVVVPAQGRIVAPGLIDLHVELREPGSEEDETIFTGTAAALAGGFTAVACMPNTDPPIDSQASVAFVRHQAARAHHCRVHVVACVSQGGAGEELAEFGQLVEAGAVAFCDAQAPIQNAELMRRAFQYSSMFGKTIFNRPEMRELARDGVMHDGNVSLVLGLSGIPAAAEEAMASRDITLAEATGGVLHLTQVSTANTIDLVRRARRRGVRVTCGVTPHHLVLTDEALRTFDSNFKVHPPLRDRDDVEACIAGLQDGTIDVICSQHAPHRVEKKLQELDRAPFGAVGLETLLGVLITRLVVPGRLDWPTLLSKLTINPARILGIDQGTLRLGADADITIIDPEHSWIVDPAAFRSRSANTPFAGWRLQGVAETVIVAGEVRYAHGELLV
jgi:dihydroorotase